MREMVWIKWVDPHSVDEWTNIEELKNEEFCTVITAGTVLFEDKKKILLALNTCSNGDASCTMVIPVRYILERKKIRVDG